VSLPLVVGSASRDMTPDDPRGWRLGGAAAYCGLTLARLGLRPRVLLGVDAAAARAEELEMLRAAGADVRLVRLAASPVFRNRATPAGRVQDCLEPGLPIPVVVPDEWRDSGAWLLVPVADELAPSWAALPPPGIFVAVGWQGLLRNLPKGGVVTRRAPRPNPLVGRARLASLSTEDLDPSTSIEELVAFLGVPATLVVTDGEAGGTIWEAEAGRAPQARRYPAVPSDGMVDPTGAGDAFMAALVAARLGHPLAGSGRHGADVRLAAAVASLAIEAPGLGGIPGLGAIADRLRRSLQSGQRASVGAPVAPEAGGHTGAAPDADPGSDPA
jgi:hypothetical protein